jgi:hypothetical protein
MTNDRQGDVLTAAENYLNAEPGSLREYLALRALLEANDAAR